MPSTVQESRPAFAPTVRLATATTHPGYYAAYLLDPEGSRPIAGTCTWRVEPALAVSGNPGFRRAISRLVTFVDERHPRVPERVLMPQLLDLLDRARTRSGLPIGGRGG